MSDTARILLALGILLGGTLLVGAGWLVRGLVERNQSLERRLAELERAIKPASKPRGGQLDNERLENAAAVLIDLKFKQDAFSARLDNALAQLQQVRNPDAPAGRRPRGWEDEG